jgi:hypothetical protein
MIRIWNDVALEVRRTAVHRAAVLEHEGPASTIQRSRDALDRDISSGASGLGASGEHLAAARGVERPVELLVDGAATERGVGLRIRERLWGELHVEITGGAGGHG